jgi:hypothetical protein
MDGGFLDRVSQAESPDSPDGIGIFDIGVAQEALVSQ